MSWEQVDQSWRETLLIVTEVGRRYGHRQQSSKPTASEAREAASRAAMHDETMARIRYNLDEFDRGFKHLLDRTRRH
jgi:hypothetical protein